MITNYDISCPITRGDSLRLTGVKLRLQSPCCTDYGLEQAKSKSRLIYVSPTEPEPQKFGSASETFSIDLCEFDPEERSCECADTSLFSYQGVLTGSGGNIKRPEAVPTSEKYILKNTGQYISWSIIKTSLSRPLEKWRWLQNFLKITRTRNTGLRGLGLLVATFCFNKLKAKTSPSFIA